MVGALNELMKVVDGLEWTRIKEESSEKLDGLEWHFSPGNSPWYNGAVESLVKTVKSVLTSAIVELQICMFEASQLVNQRPIGRMPSRLIVAYICHQTTCYLVEHHPKHPN